MFRTFLKRVFAKGKTQPTVISTFASHPDAGDELDNSIPTPQSPSEWAVPPLADQALEILHRIAQISVLDEGSAQLMAPQIDALARVRVDQILQRQGTLRRLRNNSLAESRARLTHAGSVLTTLRVELAAAQDDVDRYTTLLRGETGPAPMNTPQTLLPKPLTHEEEN